ncbi:hypothetical protein DYU11_21080 [Fibrisoma montanum]|uniref:Uncharacterized protein n=1 Tax=Fibrisoma montanum TaxID=2305895 RepID=A0A418M470_9BACT|nr:hypothetical protein [Fibrisoma montanum]RIV20541.1 hypothetical protein DYU11_21080 [Fibrisoma montanum]
MAEQDKDKTIAELQKKVETLEKEPSVVKLVKEDLTKAEAQVAELSRQVSTLKNVNESQAAALGEAATIIDELKQKLADKETTSVEIPTVSVGKETYELLTDFSWKGQEITIDVLREDAKLAAELVKEGVSTLRKVIKKS